MAVNKIILTGRLTDDPEVRYTASEKPVANFSVAVDRPKRKDGEKETDFFKCIAWGPLAKVCGEYLKKGRLVAVEGRLQSRKYQDKQGLNRTATEIIASNLQMLDWGKKKQETEA